MFKLINNRSKKLFEQAQKVIPGELTHQLELLSLLEDRPFLLKMQLELI